MMVLRGGAVSYERGNPVGGADNLKKILHLIGRLSKLVLLETREESALHPDLPA